MERPLILAFVVACGVLHVADRSLSPVDHAVSFYMNGPAGWVLSLGLFELGLGSLGIARGSASRVGTVLLASWSAGCIVAGVFPPDPMGHWERPPSFSGMMHGIAAMVAFTSFPVAALVLSSSRLLKVLATSSAAATVLFFVCLAPAFWNRPPYLLGAVERLVLALYVAWLLLASGSMSTSCRYSANNERVVL